MAGGNVSPRQKMINMMYLVLMALLALNVSKEILDSFHLFEVSFNMAVRVDSFVSFAGDLRIIAYTISPMCAVLQYFKSLLLLNQIFSLTKTK